MGHPNFYHSIIYDIFSLQFAYRYLLFKVYEISKLPITAENCMDVHFDDQCYQEYEYNLVAGTALCPFQGDAGYNSSPHNGNLVGFEYKLYFRITILYVPFRDSNKLNYGKIITHPIRFMGGGGGVVHPLPPCA